MRFRLGSVTGTAALFALIAGVAAGSIASSQADRFSSSARLAVLAPSVSAEDSNRLLDSLRSGLSAGSMTPIAARFGAVTPVPDDLMAKLRNNVTVSRAGDTRVIQISFAAAEPRVAHEVARDLAGHLQRLELGSLALRVIDEPDVPTRAKNEGRTAVAAAGGAGGGALLGAMLGLFRRRRQTT